MFHLRQYQSFVIKGKKCFDCFNELSILFLFLSDYTNYKSLMLIGFMQENGYFYLTEESFLSKNNLYLDLYKIGTLICLDFIYIRIIF